VNNKFFSTNENLTHHNDNDHNVIIDETMVDTNTTDNNNNNNKIVVLKEKIRHTKVNDSQKFPPMNIHKAVELVKKLSWAKFDESVEISLKLGLDPRKPNQSVKGVASLPYGTGKVVRVCVFALGNQAKEAKAAGADLVGGEELVAQIQAGNINFDTFIATPETMIFVGKLGRVSQSSL
jgi:ribosomal protein L1